MYIMSLEIDENIHFIYLIDIYIFMFYELYLKKDSNRFKGFLRFLR